MSMSTDTELDLIRLIFVNTHIGQFSCQHRHPENFWNPAFQLHPSGAERVAGVVAVAHDPARHRDFLLAFTAAAGSRETGDGFTLELSRGEIEVTTPAAFERRYELRAPDVSRGLRLAALRFSGATLAASQHDVLGAALVFEPSR